MPLGTVLFSEALNDDLKQAYATAKATRKKAL